MRKKQKCKVEISRKYSVENAAFENLKTIVIILKTNLQIKHFISIVFNIYDIYEIYFAGSFSTCATKNT